MHKYTQRTILTRVCLCVILFLLDKDESAPIISWYISTIPDKIPDTIYHNLVNPCASFSLSMNTSEICIVKSTFYTHLFYWFLKFLAIYFIVFLYNKCNISPNPYDHMGCSLLYLQLGCIGAFIKLAPRQVIPQKLFGLMFCGVYCAHIAQLA